MTPFNFSPVFLTDCAPMTVPLEATVMPQSGMEWVSVPKKRTAS